MILSKTKDWGLVFFPRLEGFSWGEKKSWPQKLWITGGPRILSN